MALRAEPIDELVLLAALARAVAAEDRKRMQSTVAHEQRRDVPLGTVDASACADHLGGVWIRDEGPRGGVWVGGPSPVRVQTALRNAARAGLVIEHRETGKMIRYEVSPDGQVALERALADPLPPELPEDPALRAWRLKRDAASERLPGLREAVRDHATAVLEAVDADDVAAFFVPREVGDDRRHDASCRFERRHQAVSVVESLHATVAMLVAALRDAQASRPEV